MSDTLVEGFLNSYNNQDTLNELKLNLRYFKFNENFSN